MVNKSSSKKKTDTKSIPENKGVPEQLNEQINEVVTVDTIEAAVANIATPEVTLFDEMEKFGLIVRTSDKAVLTRLGSKFASLIMSGRVALERSRVKKE